ncbi:MAG: roadblock/LC7 domain-containing protein [Chloroflexi bacterium]|nr:roadblock/LC7 domain-containing protein [Chloroflexota bacterium]
MANFPEALKHCVGQAPKDAQSIRLPAKIIVDQLSLGAVKITFGELRQASPAGLFSSSSDQDQTPVELPLADILGRLKPGRLPRRRGQKQIPVPSDISNLFGPKGEPLSQAIAPQQERKPASGPAPGTVEKAQPEDAAPSALPTAKPVAREPAPAPPEQLVAKTKGSAAPAAPSAPLEPEPAKPIPFSIPAAPKPAPVVAKPLPVPPTPAPAAAQPLPVPPKPLPIAVKPETAPAVALPQPALAPVQAETLVVPLSSCTVSWPEAVRQQTSGLKEASLDLPLGEVERALKRGKAAFTWGQLRGWIKPSSIASSISMEPETQLELPLPVLAPLFMAKRRPAPSQKKYVVADNIPNVFEGKKPVPPSQAAPPAEARAPAPASPIVPMPAIPEAAAALPAPAAVPIPPAPAPVAALPAPVAAPIRPVPAAVPTPASTPAPSIAVPRAAATTAGAVTGLPAAAPAGPVPKPVLSYGQIFGQPDKKNWTPAEIVQSTARLRGLAGALIVLPDGLLVAGQLPPGLNGETIAAFVPQMFGRMQQYTKELKLGDPGHLTILIESVPLQIFKAGTVYLAVLGRAGEPLPRPQLTAIAAQLSRN